MLLRSTRFSFGALSVLALMMLLGCVGAPQPYEAARQPNPPIVVEPAPAPVLSEASQEPLEQALTASLDYLERDGFAWMRGETPLNRQNGCISCHVVAFSLWSHRAVERRGYTVADSQIEELAAEAEEFIAVPGIGRAVTWGQMAMGRSDTSTESLASWFEGIRQSQEIAGHWRARGQFPDQRRSIEESDAVATLWSLLALADDSPSNPATLESIEAGFESVDQFESEDGVSLEWLAMRALVEGRMRPSQDSEDLLVRLETEQNSDGGWSWLLRDAPGGADDPSNAYTTGVALYVLGQLGRQADSASISAAVDYLLASQHADGTWQVPSRLASTLPSEEKDYIYEYWGTAWAVIGLAELLEEPKQPRQL